MESLKIFVFDEISIQEAFSKVFKAIARMVIAFIERAFVDRSNYNWAPTLARAPSDVSGSFKVFGAV